MHTLADLTPDPQNARSHTPRNVGTIVDSLHAVGTGRSVVIDEHGVILAGNATVEAAAQAGITRVQIVDSDGETLIAVRRTGLTPAQKTRLALADNRAAELATWDTDVLAQLAADTPDVLAGLWREDELAALLADMPPTLVPGNGGDDFDSTPTDGPTRVQPGDVWQVGPHRLVCGDSSNPDAMATLLAAAQPVLLWADPPYGQEFQSNYRTATPKFKHLIGDEQPYTAFLPLCVTIPVWYICQRWRECRPMWAAIEAAGYTLVNWIVWHKSRGGMGDLEAAYRPTHETILYATRERTPFTISGRDDDTWDIDTDAPSAYTHPTQKPIALPQRAIENHTRRGDAIYDPCAGSGPSLIAAHRTGRTAYLMEIDPVWADVILRRAEAEGIGPIVRIFPESPDL